MKKKLISNDWRQFFNLIRSTQPSKLRLIIAVFMSIMMSIFSLVIPVLTKNLVDNFSINLIRPEIILVLATMFVIRAIMSGFSIYLLNHEGQKVVANLRKRLWKKFLALPIPYFDNNSTGEMISRMTNDTSIIMGLITNHITTLVTGLISIIGSIIVLFFLDWKMTIIMLGTITISLLTFIPLGKKMYKIARDRQDENARFTSVISSVLSEIRLVKVSNAEKIEYNNGIKKINNLLQFGIREGKIQSLISPLTSLISMVLLVIMAGYGGIRVSSGVMSAGNLIAFILYLFQIFMPLVQFTSVFTQVQKAKGATERIISILESSEDNIHKGREIQRIEEPIELKNVTFAYKNSNNLVLKDISFKAEPGKVTAIVGPSGSGKTTIFSLLLRYYVPLSGTIKLGNEPINNFSVFSWRQHIGFVSQDNPIIDGTIRDNIIYGLDKDISETELKRVIKLAYADEFINKLPKGYNTEVGERGLKLSGGQRQRIGIARALLRNPSILMLDEATSNLDTKSEFYVQKALNNLMKRRTTLIIAHRLSTIINSDRIIFLENGTITGNGTHKELLQTHNMYREFVIQQLGRNIDNINKDSLMGTLKGLSNKSPKKERN